MNVKREATYLRPNPSRVLLRPFNSAYDSAEAFGRPYELSSRNRIDRILNRVIGFSETEACELLTQVVSGFGSRHRNLHERLQDRYEQIRAHHAIPEDLSNERRLLIGSYFMSEYSIEAAALFNPSMVLHPDQSNVSPGSLRFLLSLRAVGEGHISSITFREGIISADHKVNLKSPGTRIAEPRRNPQSVFPMETFRRKLDVSGLHGKHIADVLGRLTDPFRLSDLQQEVKDIVNRAAAGPEGDEVRKAAREIWAMALSNADVEFPPDQPLDERVIFPMTPPQKNGIEDARFVRFQEDDGTAVYYATFTAYDGSSLCPQLFETRDFRSFRSVTLHGSAVKNKGMALFARKIDGRYVMLGRQDGESISIMFSDTIWHWDSAEVILRPQFPWESIQLGNCGSPLETESGWLVLSHGVGPVRTYSIGAFLLDRKDPRKVLARSRRPILEAEGVEREGYVPNVVYSCGGLIHNGAIIVPYGVSDAYSGFAVISVEEVLRSLK